MLTAGLDLRADSAYTAKAHPGLPQPSRPVLALNFCRILFLLTPPQCQSPSGFAFLRNLGKGLEVYYYVLFSIVNFMSACLVSLEKAPTSSEKQALCLFFYLSQNWTQKGVQLTYVVRMRACAAAEAPGTQRSCFSVKGKKQMFFAIYLSSIGSNTSLTSLIMLGRYFKAAPCKKNAKGRFNCQARQIQNLRLDSRKRKAWLSRRKLDTNVLAIERKANVVICDLLKSSSWKSGDTAFCLPHQQALPTWNSFFDLRR